MHSTRWSIHFLLALAYILLGVSQCNAGQVAMVSGGLTYSAVNVEKTAGAAFPDIAPSHLSSITSLDGFASLSHPAFPEHGVRIKKTEFCDPTVNVYTGYLDVAQGAKHLFFYFFESRRNPDKDDVVMWINGGPGCSSSVGLLMELGPCRIDNGNSSNGTIWNPYGWNAETNIFFLDQPVGVGFSYADFGETVGTTEDAAKDVYAFISIFFSTFRQFEGRPFHLAGESYAGRYLPVFASEIYDQTHLAPVEGRPTINLQSILIGNGITDISTLYPGRYAIECGTDSLGVPFQTIANCIRMKKALPRCQTRMKRSCIDMFDEMDCRAAIAFCDSELSAPLELSGRNPYDVSKSCVGSDLCYAEIETINAYLRRPDVVHLLGAQSPHPFSSCSEAVGNDFSFHFDKFAVPTQHYVSNLLDRGVRVLIYAGTYDWRCNWVANKLWVDKLDWHGGANYVQEAWRDWHAGNATAGQTKSWGPLTFATVSGAGHMMSTAFSLAYQVLKAPHVPFDKPAESSHMISRWIAGEWL